MESFLIAVGALVPMLLVLVVVHELGHFYTARKLGVKVLEFGVGFPPRAFGIYTGRTPLIIHPDAVFINLDGPESLRRGQLVKIASTEDPDGNLVACIVEAPRTDVSFKDKLLGRATISDQYGPANWLRHEGKVRSVGNGSFVVADMLYSVNWTPLGGFVRLAGENNPEVPRSMASKGVGSRFLVLVAGPLMNAILPIALFTIMLMLPQDVEVGRVAVTGVAEGSPAQVAGLRQGDIVTHAGGEKIENIRDLDRAVNLNGGSVMQWRIDRGGQEQVVQVQPEFAKLEGRWVAGVGIRNAEGGVLVTAIRSGYPAALAGVEAGDIVASVGGQSIESVEQLTAAIQIWRRRGRSLGRGQGRNRPGVPGCSRVPAARRRDVADRNFNRRYRQPHREKVQPPVGGLGQQLRQHLGGAGAAEAGHNRGLFPGIGAPAFWAGGHRADDGRGHARGRIPGLDGHHHPSQYQPGHLEHTPHPHA